MLKDTQGIPTPNNLAVRAIISGPVIPFGSGPERSFTVHLDPVHLEAGAQKNGCRINTLVGFEQREQSARWRPFRRDQSVAAECSPGRWHQSHDPRCSHLRPGGNPGHSLSPCRQSRIVPSMPKIQLLGQLIHATWNSAEKSGSEPSYCGRPRAPYPHGWHSGEQHRGALSSGPAWPSGRWADSEPIQGPTSTTPHSAGKGTTRATAWQADLVSMHQPKSRGFPMIPANISSRNCRDQSKFPRILPPCSRSMPNRSWISAMISRARPRISPVPLPVHG